MATDHNVIDLTEIIRSRATLNDDMEDLIELMIDAGLVTDERPDGLLITPFGARAATLLLHHVIVYGQRQGFPMNVPDDVGAAAVALEEATNPT